VGVYQLGQPIEITDFFSVDGVATDPTIVTWSILGPDGVTVYTNASPEVANPVVGEFILSIIPTLPGTYHYDVDATGVVEASRSGAFSVLPDVSGITNTDTTLIAGPCTAWVDSQSIWDCCGQPTTIIGEGTMTEECPVNMSQYAYEASQLLWELSGRIYAGHCQRTVVACEPSACGCGFQVLSRGHVVTTPWLGPECWTWPCGHPSIIKLPGVPVAEVVEVEIDGVALDPSAYRLLSDRRSLARIDGERWPTCDSLCTFEEQSQNLLTYNYGMDPPLAGVHAAAELGCQLYKACVGAADCQLPSGATRVTRQGVTIERSFMRYDQSMKTWQTGLTLVDIFLNSINPRGLRRRPAIWSPSRQAAYAKPLGA